MSGIRALTASSFLALLLALGSATTTQKGKLVRITVTGSQRFSAEQIVSVSGLSIGQEVTRDDLQAAADRLAQIGYFRDVEYRFTSQGSALTLELFLKDAPTVEVSFDNFPWFTDEELLAAMRQTVPLFNGTVPEDGAILELMRERLEKLLETRGGKARVAYRLMARLTEEGMFLQFFAEGASLKMNGIVLTHPLAAENRRIRELLPTLVGKPYSRFVVELFLHEHVRPLYTAQGHLRARLGPPEPRFVGDPDQPLPDSVIVRVPIEPGRVYRIGSVSWSGYAAFGPVALEGFFGMKPGDVADDSRIVKGWQRLADEYGRRGYLEARIEPEPIFDDANAHVHFHVAIREGMPYRMGQLIITGLSLTAERLVVAAWKIPPGEILDRVYFEEFVRRLEGPDRTAIFGEHVVHYTTVGRLLRPNPETRTADVLIDFK